MLAFIIGFLGILFAILGFVALRNVLHNPNYDKENKKSFVDKEFDNMGFVGKSLFGNYITARNTQRIAEALEELNKKKKKDDDN
jgi:F0F1-type ATP synthase delta subunit